MGNRFTSSTENVDATVEVGFELDGERAVVHRLGEFAPGDLAFGDKDDAAQTGAGGVGSHGGGGVAGGGAGDPLELALGRNGEGGGHAGVLEGGRRVHALVFGQEPVDARSFCAARKIVEGRVAFAKGDDFFEIVDDGEQVAEAPDTGLVTAMLDDRRSCQSQRRALGLGRRLLGSAGVPGVAAGLASDQA